MNGFRVWVRKEILEITRTWRRFVLPLLLLIMAILSPVLAKLTPALLRSVATSEPGFVIQIPEPTANDAILQWGQSLGQIVLFGVIVLAAGLISSDLASGAGQLALVKPLGRPAYILAKVLVLVVWLVVLTLVAAIVCGIITRVLFGSVPIGRLAQITGVWIVLATMFVCIMTLLSTRLRSQAAAAGAGIGIYFIVSILALWQPAKEFSPVGLMTAYNSLAVGRSVSLMIPVITSCLVAIVTLLLAIRLFRYQTIR